MKAGHGILQPADQRQSQSLARSVAALVPTALMAHPLLISPMLFAAELRKTADLRSNFVQNFAEADTFLLTATYFPILFLVAVTTFLLARPDFARRTVILLVLIAGFVGLTFVSAAWSMVPRLTMLKAIHNAMVVAAAILPVIVVRDPARILRPMFWLCAVVALANLFSVLSRPPGPIGHEGIYEHKNILGGNSGYLLFFGLYAAHSLRLFERTAGLVTAAIALLLLFESDSKTAAGFVLIAPVFAFLAYGGQKWLRISPGVVLLGFIGLLFAAYPLFSGLTGIKAGDIVYAIFKDTTFTGRTYIWEFTLDKIAERPVLGYGLVGLGLFGLILGVIFANAARLLRFNFGFAFFALTVLIYVVGTNLLESVWFMSTTMGTVLTLVLGTVSTLPQARLIRSSAPMHQEAAGLAGEPA